MPRRDEDGTADHSDNTTSAALSTTMPNSSPFLFLAEHVETLSQSEGFTILRRHLATHYTYDLCDCHTPAHLEDVERWLITRDVLHALLVPVVELFDRACGVAGAVTHASKLEDLEYAFSGPSRNAFVWLQCFLSSEKERDWCYTRGCPACVVEHTLDSEFTVRLLYAACLLSDVHYPFTMEGPTLPSFMFFLDSLETAVAEDQLFGQDFFEIMQPKAISTRDGVESLIHQCLELDALLSHSSTPDCITPESSLPASPVMGPIGGTPGIKIKRSRMAKKQMSLKIEEQQWMESMLQKCWQELQPAQETVTSLPPHGLDVILKSEPTVAISEVEPE